MRRADFLQFVKILTLMVLLVVSVSSCAYIQTQSPSARKFQQESTSGKLVPGMTDQEVRALMGSPQETASRKTMTDVRFVWTYTNLRVFRGYFFVGVISAGLGFLLPAIEEKHYLIFSDGVLIGWDLPDPYAPDLVVEKRER